MINGGLGLPIGTDKGDSRFASASELGLPMEATIGLPITVKKGGNIPLSSMSNDDVILAMGRSLVAR